MLHTSGTINLHVVFGVLMGLILSDLITYDMYLKFQIGDRWIHFFYKHMNLYRRMATTLRPTITKSVWLEVWTQYVCDTIDSVVTYNIPNELIIKVDQTSSNYVPIENVTMVEKNSKHVVLTYNRKHWSLEKETLNLIQNIICPYIKDAEKKLGLYVSQKSLLL